VGETRVLVVGRGPLPAFISRRLAAEEGLDVVFVRPESKVEGPSSSQCLLRACRSREELSDLGVQSLAVFQAASGRGARCFTRTGLISLAGSKGSEALLREAERLRSSGVPLEILAGGGSLAEEGARRFPHLSWEGIETAVLESFGGVVDSLAAEEIFLDDAKRRGAKLIEAPAELELITGSGQARGIRMGDLLLEASFVVRVGSVFGRELESFAVDSPPSRLIRVERWRWPNVTSLFPALVDEDGGWTLRPGGLGEVIITAEEREPTEAEQREMARARMPLLGTATCVESWFERADGLGHLQGVLDWSLDVSGLFLVVGWGSDEVALSPGLGEVAAGALLRASRSA
jgi:glycine/D-amino acid oxidase-like deaminating enzyme